MNRRSSLRIKYTASGFPETPSSSHTASNIILNGYQAPAVKGHQAIYRQINWTAAYLWSKARGEHSVLKLCHTKLKPVPHFELLKQNNNNNKKTGHIEQLKFFKIGRLRQRAFCSVGWDKRS